MYKKISLMLVVLALGGCRIVSQQELADLKSPPNPHMADIDRTWQDQLVPQVVAKARPVAELMTALRAAKDIDSACKALGYRAQDENPCVFYVKVEGNISKIDSASRSGKMDFNDQVLFGEYSRKINEHAVKMIQTAQVKTGEAVQVYGVFSAWDIPQNIPDITPAKIVRLGGQ